MLSENLFWAIGVFGGVMNLILEGLPIMIFLGLLDDYKRAWRKGGLKEFFKQVGKNDFQDWLSCLIVLCSLILMVVVVLKAPHIFHLARFH